MYSKLIEIDYKKYYRFIVLVLIILRMSDKINIDWYWIIAMIWVPLLFSIVRGRDIKIDCNEKP